MTNSSRYNESLACEAFIQVNKVTGSTIFHCQKRTALRRRDRLKYPTLQNRNIYLFCAHVACFLSVFCASDSAEINCYERAQAKGDKFENF